MEYQNIKIIYIFIRNIRIEFIAFSYKWLKTAFKNVRIFPDIQQMNCMDYPNGKGILLSSFNSLRILQISFGSFHVWMPSKWHAKIDYADILPKYDFTWGLYR